MQTWQRWAKCGRAAAPVTKMWSWLLWEPAWAEESSSTAGLSQEATGRVGEIGHVHVTDEVERECNCGNWGCLEQVASATGIVYLAKRHLAASDKPSALRSGEVSAKAVFDAVKDGDELAIEVAEQFGKYLGTALSVIAGVVDPEVFVIGGGVSRQVPFCLTISVSIIKSMRSVHVRMRSLRWLYWEMMQVSTGRPGWCCRKNRHRECCISKGTEQSVPFSIQYAKPFSEL